MELSNPVLSGLIRKPQELAEDLKDAQTTLRPVALPAVAFSPEA